MTGISGLSDEEFSSSIPQEGFRSQAASGFKWTAVSGISTAILQLVQLAVLARILQPSDFGLMAMVLVIMGLTQAVADMGISNSLIQRQGITRSELATLFWTNIGAGLIATLLLVAFSQVVVLFFDEPRLGSLIPLAALFFVVVSPGQQFQHLLQRELRFRQLALGEVAASLLGTAVAITLGLMGSGVYALLFGHVVNGGARSVAFMRFGWHEWKPAIHFSWKELRDFVRFGLHQMGERLVNYYSANVDYLVIGPFLGPEILGAYTIAYQVVVIPLTKINPIITRVAFPVFAKRQESEATLRTGFLEVSKALTFVVLPVLLAVAVVAPVVVPMALGDGWQLTIGLVQILVVVGILKAIGNPSGSILLAKGRVEIGFYWNLFIAVINSLAFFIAVRYGVTAVALTYAFLTTLYFLLGLWVIRSVIGLSLREYFGTLVPTAASALIMGGVMYSGLTFLRAVFSPNTLVPVLIVLGALTFGFFMNNFEGNYLRNLAKTLRGLG